MHRMAASLETERLLLRPLSERDLDAWAAFLADPQATRLLHTPQPIPDRGRALVSLLGWMEQFEDPVGMYSVDVRESGESAGFVGFARREFEWGREIELGWLFRREFWGRGYASEAARALRPVVAGRVVSMIRVENGASANVARKLGMTVEREVEWYGFPTRVWVSEGP
jgi:RimJ/RimL family protein N-acetyltransferase